MIQNIDINSLYSHPDNPRKDLGDLSELAASIKAKGILQNLTVVPGHRMTKDEFVKAARADGATKKDAELMYDGSMEASDGYTVIIGHRRLAAAKEAGLTEVPCAVCEMDEKEQIATMLLENIQRADLTVYEQAKGFQMMLDLGDTVGEVSERTGFSESTIRRRTKLLELDEDKFKAAEARGGTLFDYMELDKIEDPEEKNKLLDKIGTDDFSFQLKSQIRKQENIRRLARIAEEISAWAEKTDKQPEGTVWFYGASAYGKEMHIEKPEDADEVKYYCVETGNYVSVYREKAKEQIEEEDEKAAERTKKERERKERVSKLDEAAKNAYELRRDFCESVSSATVKKHFADILSYFLYIMAKDRVYVRDSDFCKLLHIEEDEHPDISKVRIEVEKNPELRFWQTVCILNDDSKDAGFYYGYDGEFKDNPSLVDWYLLLQTLGYKISSDEKALMNGTSKLFLKEDEE